MPAHKGLDRSDQGAGPRLCSWGLLQTPLEGRDGFSLTSSSLEERQTSFLNPLSLHKPYTLHVVSMAGDVRSLGGSEQCV